MSEAVTIALIVNTATVLVSLIVSVGNRRRINQVHKATNSMKDELVAATKSEAFKDGVQHQRLNPNE